MTQTAHIEKRYFKNLNASRFPAFILVLLAHAIFSTAPQVINDPNFLFIQQYLKFGIVGLDYFFVLSSFLISWIILEEKQQRSGAFSFRKFMIRRTLRIWPLYFLIVALGYGLQIAAESFNQPIESLPPLIYYLLFISNFYIIDHGNGFLFFMIFLWSISVEEQFYVVWAVVNKLSKQLFVPVAVLCILVSVVFRFYTADTNSLAFEIHTLSVLGNFGIGALTANGLFHRSTFIQFLIQKTGKWYSISLVLIALITVFTFPIWNEVGALSPFSKLVFSILSALIILDWSAKEKPYFNLERFRLPDYFGKISYGLYCYHGVVLTVLIQVFGQLGMDQYSWQIYLVNPLMALILSMIFAHLSYRYFELFFLKLKKRFY